MFLGATSFPELEKVLDLGDEESLCAATAADVSLTTAVNLGILFHREVNAQNLCKAERIRSLKLAGVGAAIDLLNDEADQLSEAPFGSSQFELYRLSSKHDLISQEWSLFYDRFRRSASNGRKGQMYRSVGGVLGEMGDNVVSHAYGGSEAPFLGMAGYHVDDHTVSFCVADAGKGFLTSLRTDPRWHKLCSEKDALNAIVYEHATSRPREKTGGGFNSLFSMLLGFNGLVILRSGGCCFCLSNRGSVQSLKIRTSQHIEGSSVTVIICENGDPQEKKLRDFS